MSLDNAIVLAISGNLVASNPAQTIAEIRACLLRNQRVIVAVGASHSETQAALAQANLLPPHTDQSVLAWVMSSPQRRAVAHLVDHLNKAGISAIAPDTSRVGPTARGPLLDAEPRTLRARTLAAALENAQVAVFAAGAAQSEDLRPALVGGGHPLTTAVFIAAALALPVRYLMTDDEAARLGNSLNPESDPEWATIPRTDQHALLFAQRRSMTINITSPVARSLSRCGHTRSHSLTPDQDPQPIATQKTDWHNLTEVKRDGRSQIARAS